MIAELVLTATVATSTSAYKLSTPLEKRLYVDLVTVHRKHKTCRADLAARSGELFDVQADLDACKAIPQTVEVTEQGFGLVTVIVVGVVAAALGTIVGAVATR